MPILGWGHVQHVGRAPVEALRLHGRPLIEEVSKYIDVKVLNHMPAVSRLERDLDLVGLGQFEGRPTSAEPWRHDNREAGNLGVDPLHS